MHQVFGFIRYRVRIAAICVHDPQVVAACTVTDKGNLTAVRAKARLVVPLDAVCQSRSFAAANRYRINITQHIKYQGFSIMTDGNIRPGRCCCINAEFLRMVLIRAHIPLGFFFGSICGFICKNIRTDEQKKA